MYQTLPLWPARASAMATRVDAFFIFMIAICGLFTLMVFTLIFIFAIRYRRSRNPVATQIEGSNALEATWTLIPFCIFIFMFLWAASIYVAEARPPADSMEIYTVAKQWMWKFEHPDGQSEIDSLHVPLGRDVRMTMISQDVIHSFYVPAFRIKQDVLPGRYTTTWFRPTKAGHYHLFCAEYCGTQHSGMIGEVVVMDPADYETWLAGGAGGGSLSASGQKMFTELGCATCHRSDTQGRGPNLVGVYGSPVKLEDGRTVIADDNYVRESILTPAAKVVAGYKPIMPVFKGIVSEEQLLSLIAYVKSLKQPGQAAPVSAPPAVPAAEAPGKGR
jgi:cytochrome c oxidase subunit 2